MSSKRLPRAIPVTTTLATMVSANLLMVPKPAHATQSQPGGGLTAR